MQRAMSVWLPTLAVDLWKRRDRRRDARPEDWRARESDAQNLRRDRIAGASIPLLIVAESRGRRLVVHRCALAAAAGVCPGMPEGESRALLTGPVRVEPHDPARDLAALRRLALWAQRFSPIVAVDPPDGLLLDVSGCAAVFGGERRLLRGALVRLRRLGFEARGAIAPTIGCAWATARFGESPGRIVRDGNERAAIAPLPLAALRIEPEAVEALAEVGVETVAQLLEVPRSHLPSRFGADLLRRVDQALGQAIETLDPVREAPPPEAEIVSEGPTTDLEAIGLAVREALGRLIEQLAVREAGARTLVLWLHRSDAAPLRIEVRVSRPTRRAKHLWSLLCPRLERAHLGFGVERIRLVAPGPARLRHGQAAEWDTDGGAGTAAEHALDELIDTLASRLGADAVAVPEIAESHVPERASRLVRAGEIRAMRRTSAPSVSPGDRPPMLLGRPEPARVLAVTPDGPVARVSWNGRERTVTACIGPERIAPEWWRARGEKESWVLCTRDYFKVQDEAGRWLWVCRELETNTWYVHGLWA